MIETTLSVNGIPIRLTDERWSRIITQHGELSDSRAFRQPSHDDDSELTPDDIVIRYAGDEIIGQTVLHASRRFR